jgi:hypothetical protein
MDNKDIDYTSLNYTNFKRQLKKFLYEEDQLDPAKVAQAAKLQQQKADLEKQIAALGVKQALLIKQIDALKTK